MNKPCVPSPDKSATNDRTLNSRAGRQTECASNALDTRPRLETDQETGEGLGLPCSYMLYTPLANLTQGDNCSFAQPFSRKPGSPIFLNADIHRHHQPDHLFRGTKVVKRRQKLTSAVSASYHHGAFRLPFSYFGNSGPPAELAITISSPVFSRTTRTSQ